MKNEFEIVLAKTLYLKEPWYIAKIDFDDKKVVFVAHVGIQKNAIIPCPCCGGPAVHYGYEPTERSWRHTDCLTLHFYVHCRRPRIKCSTCGVQQISAPFERKHSRCTLWFEEHALDIMKIVPRSKAADFLQCREKLLASIHSNRSNQEQRLRTKNGES